MAANRIAPVSGRLPLGASSASCAMPLLNEKFSLGRYQTYEDIIWRDINVFFQQAGHGCH